MSKNNSFEGKDKIKEILKKPNVKVHFLGVGGVGMYSLFELSKERNIKAGGSDIKASKLFDKLFSRGENVKLGSNKKSVLKADMLVYTLAVSDDDEEIQIAKQKRIPIVSRAEYMSALTDDYRFKIGVSGSHGKSTVTAMIAEILKYAGRAPTVICGANLPNVNSPLIIGKKDFLVYESCEYKDSFLKFKPDISVFTNLELDHVDYFKDLEIIKKSFVKAGNLAQSLVINTDDRNLADILNFINSRKVTVGESGDFKVEDIIAKNDCTFNLKSGDGIAKPVKVNIPAEFTATNAALAIAAATECGVSMDSAIDALKFFCGIERRMQYIGKYKNADVYYDYAHHPTEIKKVIEGIKAVVNGEITVVFKPHTYSRTACLLEGFKDSLSLAERVVVLDIDGIRERDDYGISSKMLADMIGERAVYAEENDIPIYIKQDCKAIIIMGAADQTKALEILSKGI